MAFGLHRLMFPLAFILAACVPAYTQQSAPVAPPITATNAIKAPVPAAMDAPQVNPVIHRLNGLKILNLLRRNGVKVAPLNDEMLMSDAVQTSITAGLSLGDGSIVARLPRAELELPEMSQTAPSASGIAAHPFETPANLFVIQRDGKELTLRFMGLDGGTGLSLLGTDGPRVLPATRDATEETLAVGQRVRVMSPGRAPQADGLTSSALFVNIAQLEGNLSEVLRTSLGIVMRLTVTAENLSPAIVGGVAVNDAGETIGLVETINGNEAQLIPVRGVRRAVERIRLRLESKPQPWLGARGTSVAAISLEQLEIAGWKRADALDLMARQIGVVLTSVPPQTPAWLASLRVGDVVTQMNGAEIRSADDFSSLLTSVGANAPVLFWVTGPNRRMTRIVSIKLAVSLNPALAMEAAEERALRLSSSDPFVARGIETLTMTSELATRLKARGGLFVVFVHPSSAASRAGMQAGDVIESVNSKLLSESNLPVSFPSTITLDVVRNGQKLELQVESDPAAPSRTRK